MLDDKFIKDASKVKKLVFCTGQVWIDIHERREALSVQDEVAIVRLEQLAPLDYNSIINTIKK